MIYYCLILFAKPKAVNWAIVHARTRLQMIIYIINSLHRGSWKQITVHQLYVNMQKLNFYIA